MSFSMEKIFAPKSLEAYSFTVVCIRAHYSGGPTGGTQIYYSKIWFI